MMLLFFLSVLVLAIWLLIGLAVGIVFGRMIRHGDDILNEDWGSDET